MELDRLLPVYDFRSRFTRRIAADPETVWDALTNLTAEEMPIARLLMSARSAGHTRLRGKLIDTFPIPVLANVPGSELVHGTVATLWRLRPVAAPLPPGDPEAFASFTQPGWAKAAMSTRLVADGPDTVVSVETRVRGNDPAARRAFARYWLLIRAGAGLIRLEFLHALARRVASSPAPPQR